MDQATVNLPNDAIDVCQTVEQTKDAYTFVGVPEISRFE